MEDGVIGSVSSAQIHDLIPYEVCKAFVDESVVHLANSSKKGGPFSTRPRLSKELTKTDLEHF